MTHYTSSNNEIASQKNSQRQNEASLRKPRTLYMDSQTGYTVYPEEIEIRDITTHQLLYQKTYTKGEVLKIFKDGAVTASFLSSLPIPAGSYECTVKSTNYKPSVFPCRVGDKTRKKSPPDSNRNTVINIDPIEVPREARTEYLMNLKREDAAIFTGFIADDELGLPLAGVRISSKNSNASTLSDERGYFMLSIPVPGSIEETGPLPDDIVIEKKGYQTEVRRYVIIWKEEVSLTRIRLKPGKGEVVIDTRKHRRHFQFPDR